MEQNILFPLIAAVVFLLSVPLFRFMPMRKELKTLKRAMLIDYLVSSAYCLLITLLSYHFRLSMDAVTNLVVIGLVAIGFAIMGPAIIIGVVIQSKLKKDKDDFFK